MKNLNTILKRTKRLYILCQLTWTLCVHYFICWVLLFSQVLVTSFSCSVDKVRLELSKAAQLTYLTHLSQDLSEVFKRGCAREVVDEASLRPHLAPVLLILM